MDNAIQSFTSNDWLSFQEGKLSVDVVETEKEIFVRSAIAGVTANDLDINVTEDTITIRGVREHGCVELKGETHVQECHWGSFSRTIILPSRVDPDSVEAVLKRGILSIKMKKLETERTVPIKEI
jgi:HSP20 family protein